MPDRREWIVQGQVWLNLTSWILLKVPNQAQWACSDGCVVMLVVFRSHQLKLSGCLLPRSVRESILNDLVDCYYL
jgi:hypothetical protein